MSGLTAFTYYHEKRECWRLNWGGESFYNNERELREWETEDQALAWLKENHSDIQGIESSDQASQQERNKLQSDSGVFRFSGDLFSDSQDS